MRTVRAAQSGSPQTTAVAAVSATSAKPGYVITLSSSGSVGYGGIDSYEWSQLTGPDVSISNSSSSSASFTAPSIIDRRETVTIQLTVIDINGGWDTDTISVVIIDNTPSTVMTNAVVSATPTSANPGETINFSSEGSTGDGGIGSYAWSQLSGSPVTIINASSSMASITAPVTPGTVELMLTVTDSKGATDTATVSVTITAGPLAA